MARKVKTENQHRGATVRNAMNFYAGEKSGKICGWSETFEKHLKRRDKSVIKKVMAMAVFRKYAYSV